MKFAIVAFLFVFLALFNAAAIRSSPVQLYRRAPIRGNAIRASIGKTYTTMAKGHKEDARAILRGNPAMYAFDKAHAAFSAFGRTMTGSSFGPRQIPAFIAEKSARAQKVNELRVQQATLTKMASYYLVRRRRRRRR